MIMVYIASPYTIGDKEENVKVQMAAADKLMNWGYCPVVPLLSHFQNQYFPRHYDDWMAMCIAKLKRCDVLLRLPGESKGADEEEEFAIEHGIPVVYSLDELGGDDG